MATVRSPDKYLHTTGTQQRGSRKRCSRPHNKWLICGLLVPVLPLRAHRIWVGCETKNKRVCTAGLLFVPGDRHRQMKT